MIGIASNQESDTAICAADSPFLLSSQKLGQVNDSPASCFQVLLNVHFRMQSESSGGTMKYERHSVHSKNSAYLDLGLKLMTFKLFNPGLSIDHKLKVSIF